MAKAPRPVAASYILLVSSLSRAIFPEFLARRAYSSICGRGNRWPPMDFGPRTILLGRRTVVSLIPHLDEFDGYALFSRSLPYETPVFDWLERHAATSYDLFIEIGANIGVYTVFMDALIKRSPAARLKTIVAFEPSQEAFARLVENLRANDARSVVAFQAAVGTSSGLQPFYQPSGHLTNGSFIREFSAQFSSEVSERFVAVICAQELARYMVRAERTLIKIDVEGFEPILIAGMIELISRFRPDFLIEILPGSSERLEALLAPMNYQRFLLTTNGPRLSNTLFSSAEHRDWLLLARE
jgi:FkbM family methyltransferase